MDRRRLALAYCVALVAVCAAKALLSSTAAAQTPQHRLFKQPNLPRSSLAFFEFAPASGTGMGAACACTTPTGAKGETLTFTRASSGTCLKGGTTSGIANGDMVTCSTNQARVMPGGDGTGGLGLLVEGARTNLLLRSEEIDNASWLKVGTGVAAPTVTANFAVGPDGATTAERVQLAAANPAQASTVDQAGLGGAGGTYSGTVFIKGNGTSGTVDFGWHDGGAWRLTTCSYVAETWTRCRHSANCNGSSSCQFSIGNNGTGAGTNRSAQDILLIGGDFEVGTFASSYIATTSAAVTRAAEPAFFAFSQAVTNGSFAATVVPGGVTGQNEITFASIQSGAASYDRLLIYVSANAWRLYGPSSNITVATVAPSVGVPSRLAGDWVGTNANVYYAGLTASGAIGASAGGIDRISIGEYASTTSPTFGVVKQVCYDPSTSRCR